MGGGLQAGKARGSGSIQEPRQHAPRCDGRRVPGGGPGVVPAAAAPVATYATTPGCLKFPGQQGQACARGARGPQIASSAHLRRQLQRRGMMLEGTGRKGRMRTRSKGDGELRDDGWRAMRARRRTQLPQLNAPPCLHPFPRPSHCRQCGIHLLGPFGQMVVCCTANADAQRMVGADKAESSGRPQELAKC